MKKTYNTEMSATADVTFKKGKKYDVQHVIGKLVKSEVKDDTVMFVDFSSSDAHSHKTEFWLGEKKDVGSTVTKFVKEHRHESYEKAKEVYTSVTYTSRLKAFTISFIRDNDGDQGTTRFELTIHGVGHEMKNNLLAKITPLLPKVALDKCFEEKPSYFCPHYQGW